VAELRIEDPTVTVVLAAPTACDVVERRAGARALRVAAGEVLLVGDADLAAIRRAIDDRLAIVDDASDGWGAVVLEGPDAAEAFARLAELRLPASGWIQGEVARAPAKVAVEGDRITILVPAHLATHVATRVRADAAEVLGT
jgi:hypothetical protein